LYFEVADTSGVHNVGTGNEVFIVDIIDVETDRGQVEATVFEVLETNFVINKLIEELIQSVFNESLYWIEA
jgi:hypothetical protein